MKKQSIFIISMIGILGAVSVSVWMFPLKSAEAEVIIGCDWETEPGAKDPTCVGPAQGGWPRIMLNPQPLPPMSNWVMLNPQPLPPMSNWVMLNPQPLPRLFLDSSLFSNTTDIKISPLNDGSIIISAINSTNGSNTNVAYQ
jgi:hypothetical protein